MSAARVIVDPATWTEIEVPAFVTDESALEKAHRRREGAVPTLLLEPDFGCVIPLWNQGIQVDLDTWNVPPALQVTLRAWLVMWEENFDFETGWRSDEAQAQWHQQGETIFDSLSRELWETADVLPTFRQTTGEGAGFTAPSP